jgi:hypothetical protein
LDLRLDRIPERRVMGIVFEADAADPMPIEGAEVSLVGDSARVAITDSSGAFDLGSVGVPEGAELFLEARRPGGFTHRFRASLGSEQRLFLLSENQIQEWTRSFEGGLSPRSGWLLGAATAAGKLRPMVHPQGGTSRLEPETYVLGAANELVPASEAEPTVGAKRWLSVELPEGEARVGLVDGAGRWERETWAPISPGVITVILFGAAE